MIECKGVFTLIRGTIALSYQFVLAFIATVTVPFAVHPADVGVWIVLNTGVLQLYLVPGKAG